MSDERVRKLLKEIEDELAGTDRTLADVIRERLRIDPRSEGDRVAEAIGRDLDRNDAHVHTAVNLIRHGEPTEKVLVALVKSLVSSVEASRRAHMDHLARCARPFVPVSLPAYGEALPDGVVADAEAFLRRAPAAPVPPPLAFAPGGGEEPALFRRAEPAPEPCPGCGLPPFSCQCGA